MEAESRLNPHPANIRVCAIVLNYESYSDTIECVRNLLEQDYAALRCVVVDNASPNDSLARLRDALGVEPHVNVLAAPSNGGYAAGNNFGARWAIANWEPDYLLITNPDVRMTDPSTISQMVAFAKSHPDAGAISPKVVLPNGWIQGPYSRPSIALSCIKFMIPLMWYLIRSRHQRKFRALTSPRRCFRTIGACMMLNARSFANVGMFDEGTFFECEEDILAERFRSAGKFFYHFPSVTVLHHHVPHSNSNWTMTSLKYYYKTYRGSSDVTLRVLELCFRFYRLFYLPIRLRLPLIQ